MIHDINSFNKSLNLFSASKVSFQAILRSDKVFSDEDAQRIKDIEKVTNHDVKAVEYFIKEKFDATEVYSNYVEFIESLQK